MLCDRPRAGAISAAGKGRRGCGSRDVGGGRRERARLPPAAGRVPEVREATALAAGETAWKGPGARAEPTSSSRGGRRKKHTGPEPAAFRCGPAAPGRCVPALRPRAPRSGRERHVREPGWPLGQVHRRARAGSPSPQRLLPAAAAAACPDPHLPGPHLTSHLPGPHLTPHLPGPHLTPHLPGPHLTPHRPAPTRSRRLPGPAPDPHVPATAACWPPLAPTPSCTCRAPPLTAPAAYLPRHLPGPHPLGGRSHWAA
ncbi:basic proline-rich protein-like [Mustela nigripes]|uniref:basic proline-rich protein-like n=1 Tax=Mustela nigripes TaxID=77151 RepID=UPI0028160D4A|nr:basic proline-rich protein-like [Mustela nigripes]